MPEDRPEAPPDTTSTDEASRQQFRFFRRLAIVTLLLSSAIALSLNLVDPDLWGHVLYGEEVLAEKALPQTATHTYTAADHRWINHENLAEIALALGFRYLGGSGMLALKCLWGVAILGLMVWSAQRRGVDALAAWPVALLVANNLIAFFILRPQLLSFMWLALLLVLLEQAFRRWADDEIDVKWFWLCPPLFALWANSHGAFIAGLAIFGAYLFGRMVEVLLRRGTSGWPVALHLAAVGIASVLATMFNPYGPELLAWLAYSLGTPRPEITEWLPPSPGDPVFAPLVVLLGVTVASLAATRERRDWTQIVVLALVSWQAMSHLRHIALFALLCGFWLPQHLQSAVMRLSPGKETPLPSIQLNRQLSRGLACVVLVTILLQSLCVLHRVSHLPVARDRYPVDALQFMVDHGLKGRLVVSFNWAQYAIAALSPEVTVGFDGRFRTCYPQEIVDMHFDFLVGENEGHRQRSPQSGPIDGRRVLEYGEPNLVLVDRSYPHAEEVMEEEQLRADCDWTLLYQDATAQLWGRAQTYDDPTSTHYLPPEQRIISDVRHVGWSPWPAFPSRSATTALADGSIPKPAGTRPIRPQFVASHGD